MWMVHIQIFIGADIRVSQLIVSTYLFGTWLIHNVNDSYSNIHMCRYESVTTFTHKILNIVILHMKIVICVDMNQSRIFEHESSTLRMTWMRDTLPATHCNNQSYSNIHMCGYELVVLKRHLYPPFATDSFSLSIWDMTHPCHSYVWHDLFRRMTSTLPSYVCICTYIYGLIPSAYPCGTWLIYEIHTCDVTRSHEWPAPSLHMNVCIHI